MWVACSKERRGEKLSHKRYRENACNYCEDLDVPVSGNKDELISRIAETLR